MEEKDKRIQKKNPKALSRREFLKDAGLVAGGAALGSMALVNACAGETTVTQTITQTKSATQTANITITRQAETSIVPPVTTTVTATSPAATVTVTSPPKTTTVSVPKSGYVQWKAEECMACSRCLMACSAAKEGAIALQLSAIRWLDENEFSGFRARQPFFCQQCSSPECYYACPLKDQAMCIDSKTGARYVNKDKCNGCGICALACPFEVKRIVMDTEKKKAIKCDLCKDRAEGPVCVSVCDRLALTLVKPETRL